MKWLVFSAAVLLPVLLCASCGDSNGISPSVDAGSDAADSEPPTDGPVGGDGGGDAPADVHADGDAAPPALTGKHLWSKRFGNDSNGAVYPFRIGVDAAGNVYAAGYFNKTVDFGGGVLTSVGGYDAFVVKFDADGNHLWSKRFGDAANQATSLTIDPAGGVYLIGSFGGTIDFGGGTLTSAGASDAFIARLDGNGNHVWSKRFGGSGDEGFTAAVLTGTALVLRGGTFNSIDLGGGAIGGGGALPTPFLAKFDTSGNHIWSKGFSSAGQTSFDDIAADGASNVILSGSFQGTIDFGGGGLSAMPSGANKVYLAKFNAGGGHVWSKRYGDQVTDQFGTGIALDGTGAIFSAGGGNGTIDFGSGPISLTPGVYLGKLDSSPNGLWAKAFSFRTGTAGPVAVDTFGQAAIGGTYYGPMDFGAAPLPDGNDSAYLARFDAAGKHAWSKSWSGRNFQLAIDASSNVIVSGFCFGSVNLGGGALACGAEPEDDMLLAKFSP